MNRPQVIDKLDYNGIINGDFSYWQRGTSWNPSLSGVIDYGASDRFGVSRNIGSAQVTQSTDVPSFSESGHLSKYSLNWSPNTAIASPLSSEYHAINYCIEGNYIAPLLGQDVFLSFWVKSNLTGDTAVSFRQSAINSYVAAYSIDQADTWEQKVIKLNFPSQYSWETGAGNALTLDWSLIPAGDWATTSNQWVSGNKVSCSGINNFFSSTSNYLKISQVKLGVNYSGTSLEDMTYSYAGKNIFDEERLCHRYYEYISGIYLEHTAPGSSYGSFNVNYNIKRITNPTVTVISGTQANISEIYTGTRSDTGTCVRLYSSAAGRCYWIGGVLEVDAELS